MILRAQMASSDTSTAARARPSRRALRLTPQVIPASLASRSCLPELAPQTRDLVSEFGDVMRSGDAARLVLGFLTDEKAGEAAVM